MKECSNCKWTKEINGFIWCDNEKSKYHTEIVRSDEKCSEWEDKNEG